jgi:hypothetical protein
LNRPDADAATIHAATEPDAVFMHDVNMLSDEEEGREGQTSPGI